MEESESGINLQECSTDDQGEARKKEVKEKEEREKQGTLIPSLKCYSILVCPGPRHAIRKIATDN